MGNSYTRFSLGDPVHASTIPFRRAEVFLQNRLGGFQQLMISARIHMERYHLGKPLTYKALSNYAPVLGGISFDRLKAAMDMMLKKWMTTSEAEPSTLELEDISNIGQAVSLSGGEQAYLVYAWAMLYNSEGLWTKYPDNRYYTHRQIMIKNMVYGIVHHKWTISAFSNPLAYRMHQDWLSVTVPGVEPDTMVWGEPIPPPNGWKENPTEADERVVLRTSYMLDDELKINKVLKSLKETLGRSSLTGYEYMRKDVHGQDEHVRQMDSTIVNGINMIAAVSLCS